MTVFSWFHLIKSNGHYQRSLDYIYEKVEGFSHSDKVVVKGEIHCKNGQIIGEEGQYLLGVVTDTRSIDLIEKMIDAGITDLNSTIWFNDIQDGDLVEKDHIHYFVNGKHFLKEIDLLKYLRQINFRYSNGSLPLRYIGKYELEDIQKILNCLKKNTSGASMSYLSNTLEINRELITQYFEYFLEVLGLVEIKKIYEETLYFLVKNYQQTDIKTLLDNLE